MTIPLGSNRVPYSSFGLTVSRKMISCFLSDSHSWRICFRKSKSIMISARTERGRTLVGFFVYVSLYNENSDEIYTAKFSWRSKLKMGAETENLFIQSFRWFLSIKWKTRINHGFVAKNLSYFWSVYIQLEWFLEIELKLENPITSPSSGRATSTMVNIWMGRHILAQPPKTQLPSSPNHGFIRAIWSSISKRISYVDSRRNRL